MCILQKKTNRDDARVRVVRARVCEYEDTFKGERERDDFDPESSDASRARARARERVIGRVARVLSAIR